MDKREPDMVMVPREPTEAMIEAYYDLVPIAPGTETWATAGIPSAQKVWDAMLSAAPSEGGDELVDAEGGGTRARPLVPASSVTDRAGHYFTLSDERPIFVATIDEDAEKIGSGWVIAPAERLTEPPGRTVHRNVGWFSAFARRHGHHAQADWLDEFVREGGFSPSPGPAVDPEAVRERVARICGAGFALERNRVHGGGWKVVWMGEEGEEVFTSEDDAEDRIVEMRTDAILAALRTDAGGA